MAAVATPVRPGRLVTYALSLAAISKLVTATATCAALPVLRRGGGGLPPRFWAPGGAVLAPVALALCIWLLANSGWRELRDVGVAAALGLLVYGACTWRGRGPGARKATA